MIGIEFRRRKSQGGRPLDSLWSWHLLQVGPAGDPVEPATDDPPASLSNDQLSKFRPWEAKTSQAKAPELGTVASTLGFKPMGRECPPIGRAASQVNVFGQQVGAGFDILLADDIPEIGQVNLIEERLAASAAFNPRGLTPGNRQFGSR